MPKAATQKRYRLGVPISYKDANRILGLPVNTSLTWQDFQDHAKRKLSRKTQNNQT